MAASARGYASKNHMRALKCADKLEMKWVEEQIAREQEARKNKQREQEDQMWTSPSSRL